MTTQQSVHDNFIYGYVVSCEERELTLHTAYRDREPFEFTDLVFRELVAHSFEHVLSKNILFDLEEDEAEAVIQANAELLKESWRWGWPPIEYKGDLAVLTAALRAQCIVAFWIHSSFGLSGWVLARSCERLPRNQAAQLG